MTWQIKRYPSPYQMEQTRRKQHETTVKAFQMIKEQCFPGEVKGQDAITSVAQNSGVSKKPQDNPVISERACEQLEKTEGKITLWDRITRLLGIKQNEN